MNTEISPYSCFLSLEAFLGTTPRLKNESLIASSDDRAMLRTKSSGVVHLTLGIIERDFEKSGIVTKTPLSDGAGVGD
jgi:hypothetical protein